MRLLDAAFCQIFDDVFERERPQFRFFNVAAHLWVEQRRRLTAKDEANV